MVASVEALGVDSAEEAVASRAEAAGSVAVAHRAGGDEMPQPELAHAFHQWTRRVVP